MQWTSHISHGEAGIGMSESMGYENLFISSFVNSSFALSYSCFILKSIDTLVYIKKVTYIDIMFHIEIGYFHTQKN